NLHPPARPGCADVLDDLLPRFLVDPYLKRKEGRRWYLSAADHHRASRWTRLTNCGRPSRKSMRLLPKSRIAAFTFTQAALWRNCWTMTRHGWLLCPKVRLPRLQGQAIHFGLAPSARGSAWWMWGAGQASTVSLRPTWSAPAAKS